MSDMTDNRPEEQLNSKKPYTKPVVESEQVFESLALACGKCQKGPKTGSGCKTRPSAS